MNETIEEEYHLRDEERFLVQQVEGEFAGVEKVFTQYEMDDNKHEKPSGATEDDGAGDRSPWP